MLKRNVFVFILLFFCISCSPFSREIIRQSDEQLTIPEVQQNPGKYMKRQVLWGGIIIETKNQKNNTTLIKVLKSELDYTKEPKATGTPEGRFVISYRGFLDPFIYREGRLITVAGEIAGIKGFPLGDSSYAYPVVSARQIHLWEYGYYRDNYPPPYWHDPFWWSNYPFWDNYPYYRNYYWH
jgi:outer membrane lipoprotein